MSADEHKFSVESLIGALLRDQGIHDGRWGLNVEFSAMGTAVPIPGNATGTLPGLVVSVVSTTLRRIDSGVDGGVDAAAVNPAKKQAAPRPAAKKPTHTIQ